MEANKLNNISFIKCFMIIVVVLCHSCSFYTNEWFTTIVPVYNSNFFSTIAKIFGTFHVQALCMSSGFLYFYLRSEKGKYVNIKSNIVSKIKRLIIPYVTMCIVWVIPISIYFFNYSLVDILNKYVLMTAPSQLWFLIMLFGVFLLFFTILNKVKINMRNLFIIYVTSVVIGSLLGKFGINYFQLPNISYYCLYFYFGGFIYDNRNKIAKKTIIVNVLILILLSFCYIYFSKYDIKIVNYILHFVLPIISMLEILIIYFLCTKLINKIDISKYKIYRMIEENSFGIYLFHQQIIYFTIVYLNGYVVPAVQVTLSFLISVILSLVISIILKKFKITKFLFGV